MSTKDRIKTYLFGVLLGVILLIVWHTVRNPGNAPATTPSTPAQGVPSPSDGESVPPDVGDDQP